MGTLDQLLGPGKYHPTMAFVEMGLDSYGALLFQNSMQSVLGTEPTLPKMKASVIYDYPTVDSLAEYILESLKLTGGEQYRKSL